MLPDLVQKVQEIIQSNRPDSENVTFYNEALQKPKLFLQKSQPKTWVKKSLSETRLQKTCQGQKTTLRTKKQKDWDADDQMALDNQMVPGSNIDDLFQSALKKRNPIFLACMS